MACTMHRRGHRSQGGLVGVSVSVLQDGSSIVIPQEKNAASDFFGPPLW